jgi:hypothetical protein
MDMPDLSNILGQETIKKIYEDGLSEPTKEVGKMITDIVKTFRLFLSPFQIGAAYQDKFAKDLDSVRNAVPEENQIECPAFLAGPVFDRLKYLEEGNYLKSLYLNLLKRAIDRERVNEAHPAFVSLIEQLSPDEALMMKLIAENRYTYEIKTNTVYEIGAIPEEIITKNSFPVDELVFEQNFSMYIDHLKYLNFIETPQYNITERDTTVDGQPVTIYRFTILSSFGKLFYNACIE